MSDVICGECKMLVDAAHYHPFAACLMFKQSQSSTKVLANLKAVVEYGMQAERAGATLDESMTNIHLVLKPKDKGK